MAVHVDQQSPHETPQARRGVKKQFARLLASLRDMPPDDAAKVRARLALALATEPWTVQTPRGPLSFVAFGKASAGRGAAVISKQPATIAWIDRFRPGSVFWDVGANIGVFSAYAALRGDTRVVAFEPAAVNYFLLSANCEVNGLDDRVSCLLMGLGRAREIARLEVSQLEPAMSFSFRQRDERTYLGRQSALIMSIDELVEDLGLACPNYLKVDVPGLTGPIFKGGARVLRRPDVREIHVEAGGETKGGRRIRELLGEYGFVLSEYTAHGGSADVTFVRG